MQKVALAVLIFSKGFDIDKNIFVVGVKWLTAQRGQVDERKKVLPRVQTMLLCKRNAIQKVPKSCSFSQKVKKILEKHF